MIYNMLILFVILYQPDLIEFYLLIKKVTITGLSIPVPVWRKGMDARADNARWMG